MAAPRDRGLRNGSKSTNRRRKHACVLFGARPHVLFERYLCNRPLNGVAMSLSHQGLPISAGTLARGLARLSPLFQRLALAMLEHRNEAAVRHGDETGWRIQALKVFGGAVGVQVLVVDRYSTYKKLARVLEGRVILAWCWAHHVAATISTAPPGRWN